MSVNVTMPALSPTMTSGTVAKWTIAIGDMVQSGDVIAEIETDKATMEVEAIEDGVVAQILVAAGTENVAVGTVIAVLAEDGVSIDEAASAAVVPPQMEDAAQSAAKTPTQPAAEGVASNTEEKPVGKVMPPEKTARIFVTPLARRIAVERGIALDQITGSGPHGRILKRDVESAPAPEKYSPENHSLENRATPLSANSMNVPVVGGASKLVVNSQMRKSIALRLQESKQQAPHFYLTIDCHIDDLLAARQRLNEKAPQGVKISLNDLVIRAAAMALIDVPDANVSWEGDHTRRFQHADIAIAVAIDGGLVTPIIWAAETMGLAALSKTTADLAEGARHGKLRAADYSGGSFTISNLGMYGVREFAAVINPPQAAILAVGAGEQRPVVIDGALAVATVMTVTFSADHRAVDGAVGARWLQSFKGFIEHPVTMLL
jgi:pyruvate dehydrogenase E2 component (dihydrolipoamide acetyltransferase)